MQNLLSDKFEVIKLIGEGSFGFVYKIKNRQTGKFAACKFVSKYFILFTF